MGANPLRHSNCEWEGGSWQAKPPTRVSSEGGGGSVPLAFQAREVVLVGVQVSVGGRKSEYVPLFAHPHPCRCSPSSSCHSRRDGRRGLVVVHVVGVGEWCSVVWWWWRPKEGGDVASTTIIGC